VLTTSRNRYLIGQGIGGVFFPPYSESFGRKSLYVVSTLGYCVFCAITAAVPSLGVIIFARFAMGLLSAIPTIVVAGSMEDLFNIHARVWMIFIWAMSGNVAVCIGPIYSTYIAYGVGWYVADFLSGFYAGRLNQE
jgi:MFS family permease